jgi:outer membrane protein OmpA-like peptidoglycan-associated protein
VTSNGQLARKQAQEVVKVLVEHGVLRSQLEVVSFGVTTVGKRDNQVEIVVK